jgi:two-component system, LytTR family, response regulator
MDMKLKCIIIEDEPLATKKLEVFIQRVPFLELVASFENAMGSLEFLKTNATDIILLDIQMEQLTGIQLLETMSARPYVIITSAYAEYALKGYELRVFDYLLKPFSFERFLLAVNKVYDDIQQKQNEQKAVSHIFVKTEYRIENVEVDHILYIEGMQGYLRIHLSQKKIMTKQSFKSIMEQLPANKFIQVHKSWVIAIAKIESIEHNRIKIGGALIPIGDTYRDNFFEMIKR